MSTRKIISIDQDKCNGCGLCIPNCPEGALQLIDGKARLVSDLFCDGLGACLGHCPEGAIEVIEREAEPYDEAKVMAVIAPQGPNTLRAHLEHLESHGETGLHSQALAWLREKGIPVPGAPAPVVHEGCPGMRARTPKHTAVPQPHVGTTGASAAGAANAGPAVSHLGNWPIQLHLLSPMAPHFAGKDVLLSADCVAHAVPDFHARFLDGKALAIACPKLDEGKDVYRDKLVALIDNARINTLTVAMMEVPCCRGLLAIAQEAAARAKRRIPVKAVIVGIDSGETLAEDWA
jgi:NAD-dependent dihydropyrimidine dehydrogenase PreA subunit